VEWITGPSSGGPSYFMTRTTVNCIGLQCPMPIIKTRLALNELKKDDELVIYADDPAFTEDFQRFCYLADISLISKQKHVENGQEYEIYLVKLLK
jgi:tRNA 2-thiouridine synthesizing protein A